MIALERVTNALSARGCSGRGSSWQCPAHDDGAPSLSVAANRSGDGVVVNCHAGCQTVDVVAALGLTLADLYDEPKTERQHVRAEVVAEYPYTDEHGEVLSVVKRYEPGFNGERKTFRQYRADGTPGVKGVRKVPYRLPELMATAQAGGLVFVTEGEKCADALAGIGMTATTNIGGAGKWTNDYSRYFAGASEVVVIADLDDPGRKHAAQVAASLECDAKGDLYRLPFPGTTTRFGFCVDCVVSTLADGGRMTGNHQCAACGEALDTTHAKAGETTHPGCDAA